MARVFISYRREDTPVVAARLATRLKDDLRLDNVFLDRMDILAGWPWRAVLARRLRSSDAVLVLVGDRWGGGPDGGRILAPNDMVRWELRRAMELGCELVPTMVDGARLPTRLPPELGTLPSLNFIELNPADSELGYLELLGDLFYKAVRRDGDVVVVYDDHDVAEVHVRKLAGLLITGELGSEGRDVVRVATRGFAAVALAEAAERWPEVIVLTGEQGITPRLAAQISGLRRNAVRVTAAAALGYYAGRIHDDGDANGSGDAPEADPSAHRVGASRPGTGRSGPPGWWRRAVQAFAAIGAVALIVTVSQLVFGNDTDEGGSGGEATTSTASASGLSGGSELTVRFAQSTLAKTWGDPPFRVRATANQQAQITYDATGPCRVEDGQVSLDGAGACRVTATAASTNGQQASARLDIAIAKARPKISAGDVSVMYSREFAHQLTASVEPDIPVGYRLDPDYTPSQGFRCQIENTVLTLSAGVNAGAAGASLLPVTCPIEVAALESPNIEPGQPIRFDVTVTAPTLHLVADPTSADVTGDNEVAVTLTESTGFGLAPTAASNKASNARCTPGTITRISPTQFTSTVATRGGDYTCTITWRMKSWLGGPAATTTTTITVRPPVVR